MVRSGLRYPKRDDTLFEVQSKHGLKRHTPAEREKLRMLKSGR